MCGIAASNVLVQLRDDIKNGDMRIFLQLGRTNAPEFGAAENIYDLLSSNDDQQVADDQVDVVSKAFLGVTLSCARCHDHKFDPFSQDDYYGLAGIFFSTHILPNVGPKTDGPPMLRISVASKADREKRQRYQARLADLEKQLKAATEEQYAAFAREQGPHTARYLMAAWAYQNRPPDEARLSLDEFAKQRGLLPFALRAWTDRLGAGEYRLMMKKVSNVGGKSGVHGWRGEPDCPNLVVNTTDKEVSILTFKLLPKSVSIHPGPNNGVAVGFRNRQVITHAASRTRRLRRRTVVRHCRLALMADRRGVQRFDRRIQAWRHAHRRARGARRRRCCRRDSLLFVAQRLWLGVGHRGHWQLLPNINLVNHSIGFLSVVHVSLRQLGVCAQHRKRHDRAVGVVC